jgi:MFS family permease
MEERAAQREGLINRTDETLKPEPPWTALRVVGVMYFLAGISGSTWGRFSTVYYISKGLNAGQIGIVEAVMPLVSMFTGMGWGLISDKCRRRKPITLFTNFMSFSIVCLLAFNQLANSFQSILAISGMSSVFVTGGLLDAYCLDLLGEKHKDLYGRYRAWTALSWYGIVIPSMYHLVTWLLVAITFAMSKYAHIMSRDWNTS